MKKSLLVLSSLILVNCGGNDLLNSQEEIQASKILDKQSLIQSKTNSLENKAETIVMDLSFPTGTTLGDGGCTFTDGNAQGTWTSNAAYGPNPLYYQGYMIRGYGKPRRKTDWQGIMLRVGNRPKTVISRGQQILVDDPF